MSTPKIITPNNFYTEEQIDKLLSQVKKLPLKEAMVSDGGESRIDYEYRVCRNCKIQEGDDDFNWIYSLMAENTQLINHKNWKFPINCALSEIEYCEYDAESGSHFEWHVDSLDEGPKSKRRLSVVIQLSAPEEYEGGELQAKVEGGEIITLPKKRGATVVFTSENTEHRVSPLVRGKRKSLLSWASV